MAPAPQLRSRWLWVLAAFTLFWFYPGGDPNQSSRMLLIEALAIRHVPNIDHDHARTIDKGEHRGHFYSDKAPGISLLGAPIYASLRGVERITRLDPEARPVARARVHAITFLLAGLPALFTAMLLARALERLGVGKLRAQLTGVGMLFGTLLFPYGTMLYGHALAALLLFGAFYVVLEWMTGFDRERDAPFGERRAIALGALTAGAFVVEYPTALASLVILACAAARMWRSTGRGEGRKGLKVGAYVAGGAVGPLVLHAAFATWAFGSPVALPYKYVVEPLFRAHTTGSLFGVGLPIPSAVYGALFSPYRGLFFFCPLTALVFAGYGAWIGGGRHRDVLALTLGVTLAGLAFAVSYYAWDGGLATGSRHLVPYCAFIVLPIGLLLERSRRWRMVTAGAAVVSAIVMLAVVSVSVHHPEEDPFRGNPLYAIVVPSLLRGEQAIHFGDALDNTPRADGAFNLGSLFGASPAVALAIPIAAWMIALAIALRGARRENAEAPS